MKNHTQTLVLAVGLIAVLVPIASADVPTTTGTIAKVTVYRGQALVTRAVNIDLPPGASELIVKDLPAMIVPESTYALMTDEKVVKNSKLDFVPTNQIYGVRCYLSSNKDKWQVSEIPKFKVYIPGQGNNDLWLATVIDRRSQIQVDGEWYRYVGPEWIGGFGSHAQTQWLAKVGGYLIVSLDKQNWKAVKDFRPINLKPGEHVVSFGWAGYKAKPPSRSGREEDENPILLLSVPVRIQILKSEAPTQEFTPVNERLRQVSKLFNSHVQKEPITKTQQKLGLKTDLRSFHFWRPKFTWEDIPTLLEIAQNDKLIEGMPSLAISSYIGECCREGMIALWLVEGLRREQLSRQREKQLGERMQLHIAYSRLPLNPICVKGDMDIGECEKSLEIHKIALQAYRSWWQTVGSLPAYQAAAFYPLDLTDLSWYGAPNCWPEESLRIYESISSGGIVAERTIRQLQRTEDSYDYEPGKILQTVYYVLRNPSVTAPFTADMLTIQRIILHYYDKQGQEIRTEDVLPQLGRP